MPGSFFIADSFDKMARVWGGKTLAGSVGVFLGIS